MFRQNKLLYFHLLHLKNLQYFVQGHGWHHQMFTKNSLAIKIKLFDFKEIKFFSKGESEIPYKNDINYFDYSGNSLYCEFRKI